MKRLTLLLTGVMMVGVVALAAAGDFHYGTSLICSDCHTAHYSQQHGYSVGGIFTPLGGDGPHEALLRNEETQLCLSCHNGTSFAPDVFGANGGAAGTRQAGALNAAPGHGLANDAGYDEINGHTLFSTAMPPGGATSAYVPDATEGLWCGTCHMVHGGPTYRNLSRRGIFTGDTLTYAVGTNDLTKDVFEHSAAAYTVDDVDFNEPDINNSKYGRWCQNCHVDFHGVPGDVNMGGGVDEGWKRHPVAGVNMSSTARYTTVPNHVKVMDSQGQWLGTGTDNTLTPSCMSCHKAHGNRNAFGLIFMYGTGTVTEEGDGGQFRDLCRQCHRQGNV